MEADSEQQTCSFCGRPGRRDQPMVGGLGAFICGECVDVCADRVAEFRSTGEDGSPPWLTLSDAEMLAKLPLIAQTGVQVDRFLADWVGLVRDRGLSWAEIGKALGISRQAAWERFAG